MVKDKQEKKEKENDKTLKKNKNKDENLNTEEFETCSDDCKCHEPQEKTIETLFIEAKEELEVWKNKYFEAFADLDNQRKQNQKDYSNAMKYRAYGFIENLIPIFDSFEMAFANKNVSKEVENYLKGFELINTMFKASLESEGVFEIIPKIGEKYNSTNQHAIESIETDDKKLIDTIAHVSQKGYCLHDRIIRPAMVNVYTAKVIKEENKDETK